MLSTKIKLAAMLLIAAPIVVHAKTLTCPFTDTFNISAPNQVKIMAVQTEGNLKYAQQSGTQFTLSCGDDKVGEPGTIFIDIGFDATNKCNLAIHDGPYEMNPTVTRVNCSSNKVSYIGIDHRFGSYQYTIKLK